MRLESARAAVLGVALAALALACDERSGTGTVTPVDYGSDSQLEPEGEFVGESIDELEVRLDHLVREQDQLIAAGSKDPGTCEDLCDLSRAICEVKTKMCEIAEDRVADDEYQNLCRQAKQRCQRASESCVRCVEQHERATRGGRPTPEPASCEGDPPAAEPE